METTPPPVRIIAPGAAYRRDEVDATHLAQFTQMEGLYVAENVSLADLKGTLEFFFRELFGPGTDLQFRPHFFPFTEPSYEIDIRTEASATSGWNSRAAGWSIQPSSRLSANAVATVSSIPKPSADFRLRLRPRPPRHEPRRKSPTSGCSSKTTSGS